VEIGQHSEDHAGSFARGARALRPALVRLRLRAWPIAQTAAAAIVALYLAELLLDEPDPVFAPIAAVVALGAAYGQRRERALELIGGVVLGIVVADALIAAIGTGLAQLGLMVLLAMATAIALGGGPVLVTEAAVSAMLLVLIEPASSGLPPSRLLEALIGGAVALVTAALAFPPDPGLQVGRSVQAVFAALGRTLEETSAALATHDPRRAREALEAARATEPSLRALEGALELGRETARFAPGRRRARVELDRHARAARHVEYAVRNTRVLTRHVARFLAGGRTAPRALADSIADLATAVWTLGAELDTPSDGVARVSAPAARAARRATASFEEGERDLGLAEIVVQVRSTAIDLVRAAAEGTGEPAAQELPTGELLQELVESDEPAVRRR